MQQVQIISSSPSLKTACSFEPGVFQERRNQQKGNRGLGRQTIREASLQSHGQNRKTEQDFLIIAHKIHLKTPNMVTGPGIVTLNENKTADLYILLPFSS